MSSSIGTIVLAPERAPRARRAWLVDPRHFQIAALASALVYGLVILEFPISWSDVAVLLASALGLQWLLTRSLTGLAFEPRSALVSALSLALLLRVEHVGWLAVAVAIAIGSKFVLRVRGRHIFNPTALAIALLVLSTDGVWVSPGQWGNTALVGLLMAGAGLAVLTRAERLDVAIAFALAYAGIVLARALFLGDPLAIAAHQLTSGALVLFTFFMITDPRTTPTRRAGRVLFAVVVAALAAWLGFGLYRPDGPILALAGCAPLVPLIDAVIPSRGGNRP